MVWTTLLPSMFWSNVWRVEATTSWVREMILYNSDCFLNSRLSSVLALSKTHMAPHSTTKCFWRQRKQRRTNQTSGLCLHPRCPRKRVKASSLFQLMPNCSLPFLVSSSTSLPCIHLWRSPHFELLVLQPRPCNGGPDDTRSEVHHSHQWHPLSPPVLLLRTATVSAKNSLI